MADPREERAQEIAWCRELMGSHTPDVIGFCEVCHIRMPCDIFSLAELALELHEELVLQKSVMSSVINLGDSVITGLQDRVVELEYEAMGDDL